METEKNSSKHSEKVICEIWKDIQGYEGLYQISNYGRAGIYQANIYKVCKGLRKQAGGYKWQYTE
jgi:hypothetical protein